MPRTSAAFWAQDFCMEASSSSELQHGSRATSARDLLASAEHIKGMPPWRLKLLDSKLAEVIDGLQDRPDSDLSILEQLRLRQEEALEAMLEIKSKYEEPAPQESGVAECSMSEPAPQESGVVECSMSEPAPQESGVVEGSMSFKSTEDLRDHLERNLAREWYRSRNFDQTPATTGAAKRRREARRRGEAARGHVRGVTLDPDKPSWSQRKTA